MKVVTIADELYRELDSPSGVSISSIAFWLTSNIGKLNTLLGITIALNTETQEFETELSLEEKDIFKQMYLVTYYTRLVSSNLGAAGMESSVLEVTEGNRTIRTVNRNEIAKSFQSLKRAEQDHLDILIAAYKINRATPRQVSDGYPEVWGGMNPELGGGATTYRDFYDLE